MIDSVTTGETCVGRIINFSRMFDDVRIGVNSILSIFICKHDGILIGTAGIRNCIIGKSERYHITGFTISKGNCHWIL